VHLRRAASLLVLAAAGAACLQPQSASGPALITILSEELDRNFRLLKDKGDPPPYFIAYAVTDIENTVISASLGALEQQTRVRRRIFDCQVRVGSPEFDSYRVIDGDRPVFTGGGAIPLDDNALPIKLAAWAETGRVYRAASERLLKLKTQTQMRAEGVAPAPDFSAETAVTAVATAPEIKWDESEWRERLKRLSLALGKQSGVIVSGATLVVTREVRTLVTTEGTRLQHGRTYVRLTFAARGKAADGQNLSSMEDFAAAEPARLPREEVLSAAAATVGGQIARLSRAAEADPYVGPAILSGRAAGVFFHEIFGHRIEGHRQKDQTEGQTFTKSLGTAVLPEFLSVSFDPTVKSAAGLDLFGWYGYDDEGVAARRVPVVEQGILKTFLMSRAPLAGFPQSNGHGRREPGLEPVSRQSNLFVESSRSVPDAALRRQLIAEVVRQGKPYGLYFEQVTGGYTTTGRRGLQAFTVIPLVVYRVYPDGRPDELVRGADIVGTPLSSFGKIVATSDRAEVFNGYCGAESGNVPVAAISPALLVSEIEIQRKPNPGDRPPLLPRPPESGANE
jgi:predicted Zn-dependent protease